MRYLVMLLVAAMTGFPVFAASAFSIHSIYGDHMVLQRGRPIRFAGTSTPLGTVEVDFHGVKAEVTADSRGEWVAELPAEEAGGPYELTVTPKARNAGRPGVLRDLWVGEVWICSGQSNMEMPIWKGGAHYRLPWGEELARTANDPQTRLFKVTRELAPDGPAADMPWRDCWKPATTPEALEPFSATAWYFGRALREKFGPGLAIGLIDASWGGTLIEPWIPRAQFEKDGDARALARIEKASLAKFKGLDRDAFRRQLRAEEKARLDVWLGKFFATAPEVTREAVAEWSRPSVDLSGWTKAPRKDLQGLAVPGVAWYRFEFELSGKQAGKELVFHIDCVNDADETYLDGRLVGHTLPFEVESYWAAKRDYRFTAAAGRHALAIRAMDHAGQGFVGRTVQIRDAEGRVLFDFSDGEWLERVEFHADLKAIGSRPQVTAGDPTDFRGDVGLPSTLFNAMVAPATWMNVRGAIWYQGCANSRRAEEYPDRERQLFEGWRAAFRDAAMPFIVTQISALDEHRPDQPLAADFWQAQQPEDNLRFTAIRAAQMKMADYPGTGLACTIDIGEPFDIHPKNKLEVGRRLFHEALRVAYGDASKLPGPRFRAVAREGAALRVTLDWIGEGLAVDAGSAAIGPHLGAVRGADGKWRWSEVTLRERDSTLLFASSEVPEPVAVRWCWNGYPPGVNLHRKGDGMPVFPFEAALAE